MIRLAVLILSWIYFPLSLSILITISVIIFSLTTPESKEDKAKRKMEKTIRKEEKKIDKKIKKLDRKAKKGGKR